MREKFRGQGAVVLIHPDMPGQLRLDPDRVTKKVLAEAKKAGWTRVETSDGGFRHYPKGRAARIKELIASGEVADPKAGPQAPQEYGPETFVVEVPLGTLEGRGVEPQGS